MELAKFIDHTYLQPDAQKKDIDKILAEAKQYHFASVCISPIWVSYAHKELAGSGVNVVTVIGFQKALHRLPSRHSKPSRPSLMVPTKSIWSSRLVSSRMENMIM